MKKKEVDPRAPDNGRVYCDTQAINTTGKQRLVEELHMVGAVSAKRKGLGFRWQVSARL